MHYIWLHHYPPDGNFCLWKELYFHLLGIPAKVLMFRDKCIMVRILEMDPPKALWAENFNMQWYRHESSKEVTEVTYGWEEGRVTLKRDALQHGWHLLLCRQLFGMGSAAVSCRGSRTPSAFSRRAAEVLYCAEVSQKSSISGTCSPPSCHLGIAGGIVSSAEDR